MDNIFQIVKSNKGHSIVFNESVIEKLEKERISLLLNHVEFSKRLGMCKRSFQKVIYKQPIGFKMAQVIVKHIKENHNGSIKEIWN